MLEKEISKAEKKLRELDDFKRDLLDKAVARSKTTPNRKMMKGRYKEFKKQKQLDIDAGINSDSDEEIEDSQGSIFKSLFDTDEDIKFWKQSQQKAEETAKALEKNSYN